MRYQKFKADYLFTGNELLDNKKILIIDEYGKIIEIIGEEEAGENVQGYKGIISPGFINAHCHLELSHLKDKVPEKTGLVDFVFTVVSQRHSEEEEILQSIGNSEGEMIRNGIVAVGDICNNSLTIAQKIKRNLLYYNFIETSGWLPEIASFRFEKSTEILQQFENNKLTASIVPHAPYSVSENLWGKMKKSFSGKTITIHNQESPDEDIFFKEGKGAFVKMFEKMKIDNTFYKAKKIGSVVNYFKHLSDASSVILVHNTFTTQEDIHYINQQKRRNQLISFCLCPNANLYIENTLPPVDLFVENDVNIILGTDSLASNHQLNILEEIKSIQKKYPQIETETFLKWATLNGAKALQMSDKIGSFEKGKKPGVILIENISEGNITNESKIKKLK
ncbi:MAG: amidohydrolase family protein [Ginsengibacter sp.]